MRRPRDADAAPAPGAERVRLDSWLWAARFFKTRPLAAEAIDGGRVDVNGESAKRGKPVKLGDAIQLRLGPYHYRVVVRGLSDRRGPAKEAALLYEEDPRTKAARLELAERLRMQASVFRDGGGRPTKKERRAIDEWKGRR